jgi:hypothetical protein
MSSVCDQDCKNTECSASFMEAEKINSSRL